MKFQEILSFLEDEEKRNGLIYKLKISGENSTQIHALQEIITSLNLNKPPPGIHQETLLQNTFRFCQGKECFENFRLVSKSWKHAIENMRFNQLIYLNENLEFENDARFPLVYAKYVQAFKRVGLRINEQSLGDSFSKFILENVKKINCLRLYRYSNEANTLPQYFDSFLSTLLQNSQITLKNIYIGRNSLIHLPMIFLPNVTQITQYLNPDSDNQISNFDTFMKRIAHSCPYLEKVKLLNVHQCPNIASYIVTNYSKHCIASTYNAASHILYEDISHILPVQMGTYFDLGHLEQSSYPSSLEYVEVYMDDLNLPFENGWENYKSIFALCPKLKGIAISDDEIYLDNDLLDEDELIYENIWKDRISYLKSNGIKLMSKKEYDSKFEELRKKTKWGFVFQ